MNNAKVALPKGRLKKNKTIFQFEVTVEFRDFLQKCLENRGLTKRNIGIYGLKKWLEEEKPPGFEKFLSEPDDC